MAYCQLSWRASKIGCQIIGLARVQVVLVFAGEPGEQRFGRGGKVRVHPSRRFQRGNRIDKRGPVRQFVKPDREPASSVQQIAVNWLVLLLVVWSGRCRPG